MSTSTSTSTANANANAPITQLAKVYIAPSKDQVPNKLNPLLIEQSQSAISKRGAFTIALSGGSLPAFLSSLAKAFQDAGIQDPQWDKWHVLLADERCVPLSDADSNMGAITNDLLQHIHIPSSQVYPIDETLLSQTADIQAADYETKLRSILSKSANMLDLAVLGFGPDGHTCSLFPNHPLLLEYTRWVAGIEDSPKPPPKRITLTYVVLDQLTRNILFCGAGSAKEPIIRQVFQHQLALPAATTTTTTMDGQQQKDESILTVQIQNSVSPLPCAMVTPQESLIWVVDVDAMPKDLPLLASM